VRSKERTATSRARGSRNSEKGLGQQLHVWCSVKSITLIIFKGGDRVGGSSSVVGGDRMMLSLNFNLVTKGSKFGLDSLSSRVSGNLFAGLEEGDLALMERLRLHFSFCFQGVDDILVAPAVLVTQSLNGTPLAPGLQSKNTQSLGNDHLLLAVIGRWHAFKELQSLKCGGTSGGLVREHSPDSLVEDSRRGSVMEGTTFLRVNQMSLVHVIGPTKLQTEIAAGDVDLFTTNDDNLLARDDLLGYGRSQSAEEMAFAIDNDRCGRHLGHLDE